MGLRRAQEALLFNQNPNVGPIVAPGSYCCSAVLFNNENTVHPPTLTSSIFYRALSSYIPPVPHTTHPPPSLPSPQARRVSPLEGSPTCPAVIGASWCSQRLSGCLAVVACHARFLSTPHHHPAPRGPRKGTDPVYDSIHCRATIFTGGFPSWQFMQSAATCLHW